MIRYLLASAVLVGALLAGQIGPVAAQTSSPAATVEPPQGSTTKGKMMGQRHAANGPARAPMAKAHMARAGHRLDNTRTS
jgi:hypothetical protein